MALTPEQETVLAEMANRELTSRAARLKAEAERAAISKRQEELKAEVALVEAPVAAARLALEDALQQTYASMTYKALAQAVRSAHAELAEARRSGSNIQQKQAAYDLAVEARDSLTLDARNSFELVVQENAATVETAHREAATTLEKYKDDILTGKIPTPAIEVGVAEEVK